MQCSNCRNETSETSSSYVWGIGVKNGGNKIWVALIYPVGVVCMREKHTDALFTVCHIVTSIKEALTLKKKYWLFSSPAVTGCVQLIVPQRGAFGPKALQKNAIRWLSSCCFYFNFLALLFPDRLCERLNLLFSLRCACFPAEFTWQLINKSYINLCWTENDPFYSSFYPLG